MKQENKTVEHYYTENPEVESAEKIITFIFNDLEFSFITDRGVFSKDHVDNGSMILLDAFAQEISRLAEYNPEKFNKIITGDKLDLGCGYGVIGIVVQTLYPEGKLYMSDINERALDLTKRNANNNKLSNFKVIKSSGFNNIKKKFDLILTNPPMRIGKDNIKNLLADAKDSLNNGGILMTVIGKKQGAESYGRYLKELLPDTSIAMKKKGFVVYLSNHCG